MARVGDVFSGTVKFFNADKGYGFLKRDDGSGDVFFHVSDLNKAGIDSPADGDRLYFDIEASPKGSRAVNLSR